jgi:phage gp29-like protein
MEAMAEQLDDLAADALSKLMEPVQMLVRGAESYEEIESELAAMYADMDDDTFRKVLAEALSAAALCGATETRIR